MQKDFFDSSARRHRPRRGGCPQARDRRGSPGRDFVVVTRKLRHGLEDRDGQIREDLVHGCHGRRSAAELGRQTLRPSYGCPAPPRHGRPLDKCWQQAMLYHSPFRRRFLRVRPRSVCEFQSCINCVCAPRHTPQRLGSAPFLGPFAPVPELEPRKKVNAGTINPHLPKHTIASHRCLNGSKNWMKTDLA
jgi:hypothetical protein